MARKLTEQEREAIDALRDILTEALPPAQRGVAPGIASALVRIQNETITDEDMERILKKYELDDESVGRVIREAALMPRDGEEGHYLLAVMSKDMADTAAEASAPSEAQTSAPESSSQVDGGEPSLRDTKNGSGINEANGDGKDVAAAGLSQAGDAAGGASVSEGDAVTPRIPFCKKKAAGQKDQRHKNNRPAKPDKDTTNTVTPKVPGDETSHGDEASSVEAGNNMASQQEKPGKDADSPERMRRHSRQQSRRIRRSVISGRHPTQLSEVPYVRRASSNEDEVRTKILKLDQRFWINGWLLSHPGAYTLYEKELTSLNEVLVDGSLPGDITRRQLAYRMGGDEKFFEYGSDGYKLLRAMGVEDIIRHRPMPKADLVYHAPFRRKHMRVLVTENLDPWLDVHDLMYEEGRTRILGERIHAVVLGGGMPIIEHNRLALLLDTLRADSIEVLYWGDIDRAGLEIMSRLREELADRYPLKAFTPAYQLMADRAMERYPDPSGNEQTGQVNISLGDESLICEGLTDEAAAYIHEVLAQARLVPQEILTRRDL